MKKQQGVRGAWKCGLMVGALGLFGTGACGLPQDGVQPAVLQEDGQGFPEAPASQTFAVSEGDTLPLTFVATLQNASRNGITEECLIMSGNGQDTYPSRYLWGGGANGYCGLASNAELLGNKQAAWRFIPLGGNKYVITNASRNGTEECLIMGGNGQATYPTRYLWGGGANGYCGLGSVAELLANKQAVWTLNPLGGNKYVITNASRNGIEECLIMSGNGQDTYPSRYLWGGGANGYCGLASNAELLANKQAVWTVQVRQSTDQYTVTNASRNGSTEECLIMGGNGQAENPSRYLWGGGANGYCGLASNAELLGNKQAVWKLKPLGNDKYVITNASRNGTTEECLIMSGNGQAENPSRYLWGGGANGYCGLASNAELLTNKQAVWTLKPLGNNKYVITNASRNGTTEECLIMSGNGQATYPSRYLWGSGANGYCGLASDAELLANKQAVWTFTAIP